MRGRAGTAVVAMMAICGVRPASAGTTQYEWAPLVGGGIYQPVGGPPVGYESYNGYLIIFRRKSAEPRPLKLPRARS